jgi:transcription factor C subunit 7
MKTILLCTHASTMIAISRVLTGQMPSDPSTLDFIPWTCALSTFKRRQKDVAILDGNSTQFKTGCSKNKAAIVVDRTRVDILKKEAVGRSSISKAGTSEEDAASIPGASGTANTGLGSKDNSPEINKKVVGDWYCVVNGDCSYLKDGRQRGW